MKSYYRGSAAALLVYDITSKKSFESIQNWLRDCREHSDPNLVMTLVGNKCDLFNKREVTYQEGYEFAQKYNLQFVETSAVTGENVDDTFIQTANIVYIRNVAALGAGAEGVYQQDQNNGVKLQQGHYRDDYDRHGQHEQQQGGCACA